jgi:Ca2+:H+ antiporter
VAKRAVASSRVWCAPRTILSSRQVRVVQLSLLGSVLSNLLLILGVSFVVGGLRYKQQRFREMSVHVNSALLMLATMALVFPEVHQTNQTSPSSSSGGTQSAVRQHLSMELSGVLSSP